MWVGNALLVLYIGGYLWHGLKTFRGGAAWTVLPYLVLEASQAAMLLINGRPRVPSRAWRESAFPFLVTFWMVGVSAVWTWHSAWGSNTTRLLDWLRVGPVLGSTLAIGTLGRSFAMAIEVRRVVTHGVYRYIRHPIYTAYIALWLIQVVLFRSASYAVMVALGVMLMVLRARWEEDKLSEDPDYTTWRRHTGMFCPKLSRSRRANRIISG